MEISGTNDPRFDAVRDAFAANFAEGAAIRDVGASVAMTLDGELVVDLWGGTVDTDAAQGVPWERDTIINVWSTTKTLAALACLVLADQGELDVHAPVARYWPEFKANGKEGIEVRHLMSHTAGLSGWQEPIVTEDLYDWEKVTSLLAAQEPWWEPGTASGYHAITQGYLEGEVVRRITGQTIGDFVREHVTGPLGVDFHIGTPASRDIDVAHVVPPSPLLLEDADPASVAMRTLVNPLLDAAASWTLPWRRAEIPAAGGHANARAVALVHAPMANGGEAGGVRLLSPATIELVFEEQANGQDLVLPVVLRHGIGFGLPNETMPFPSPRTAFWGGWGGSIAIIDLDRRMTFSYVMNVMGEGTLGDTRAVGILFAAYGALASA